MDADGTSKKLRKPYTITKSRDRWTEEEHERFLDALLLFGRDWKKIEDFVGTKTVIQIRSHAQKYFQKVQASGIMVHVPPPRPKRKAAHSHQLKVSDSDLVPIEASMVCSSASSCLIPACSAWETSSLLINYASDETMPSADFYPVLPGLKGDSGLVGITSISSPNTYWTGSSSKSWKTNEVANQGSSHSSYPVIPNFAEVYNFIGSMFDPCIKCPLGVYLQKLKEMDPITAKTVLVLVKNLTINMSGHNFESLGRWLSTYDANNISIGGLSRVAGSAHQMCNVPSRSIHLLPPP